MKRINKKIASNNWVGYTLAYIFIHFTPFSSLAFTLDEKRVGLKKLTFDV